METKEKIAIDFPVEDIHVKLNEIGLTQFNKPRCCITGYEINVSAVEMLYLKEVVAECATDYDEILKTDYAIGLLNEVWKNQDEMSGPDWGR